LRAQIRRAREGRKAPGAELGASPGGYIQLKGRQRALRKSIAELAQGAGVAAGPGEP